MKVNVLEAGLGMQCSPWATRVPIAHGSAAGSFIRLCGAPWRGGFCGCRPLELDQGLCLCASWIPDASGFVILNYQEFSAIVITYTPEYIFTAKKKKKKV